MDKSTAENKALEEYEEIHMFVFDLGGVKTIMSCSGLVGLDILLQTTRTKVLQKTKHHGQWYWVSAFSNNSGIDVSCGVKVKQPSQRVCLSKGERKWTKERSQDKMKGTKLESKDNG
ncbi:hypothetical protein CR513_41507, partial [Mucuna pruriens]